MTVLRTLLLSDVVDSTQLSEALGDAAMAALWARHDRVARDLLPVHGGREIDKTDGFLMLFEDTASALGFAEAYHAAIATLDPPLRARVGIHRGSVILTHTPPADVALGAKPVEVDGMAKPTAARVMSVARGGQTLVTAAALAEKDLSDLGCTSHGHWRMKGLDEPIELLEVHTGPPHGPPPDGAKVYRVVRSDDRWLPARDVPHTLPPEGDAFVGRRADLAALAAALDDSRLVTVLGTGGTGKTRLVVHHGGSWLGDWPGGAWFCDLTDARSPADICGAVARGLRVSIPSADAVGTLGRAMAGRGRTLVILDNFEQVAACAPDTLGQWIDQAPDASFAVTSREVLGLRGERIVTPGPLSVGEAVALFRARASAASPRFDPAADTEVIEELVTLLDCLPLAVELAAARVRTMIPAQLLERVDQRFRLLVRRGRSDRQGTLRATLDWSWDLLDADERSALMQIAAFEGGFDLEAAEAVVEVGDEWPADLVEALVDKSLVRRVGEDRHGMFVSVQEYARERLAGSDGAAAVERRHARHFAERHAAADTPMAVLELDRENLKRAMGRSVARGDHALAVRCFMPLGRLLAGRGPVHQAEAITDQIEREALEPELLVRFLLALASQDAHIDARQAVRRGRADRLLALTEAGDSPGLRIDALLESSRTAAFFDAERARTDAEAALEAARSLGDPLRIAQAHNALAGSLYLMDPATADLHRGHALDLGRAHGFDALVASVSYNHGLARFGEGSLAAAEVLMDEALQTARRRDETTNVGIYLFGVALTRWDERGLAAARQAVPMLRVSGNPRHLRAALGIRAFHELALGDADVAWACSEESVAVAKANGDPVEIVLSLSTHSELLAAVGRFEDGQDYLSRAEAETARSGVPNQSFVGLILDAARRRLDGWIPYVDGQGQMAWMRRPGGPGPHVFGRGQDPSMRG